MYHLGEKDYSWANQTEMCNFLKAGGGGGGGYGGEPKRY